MKWYQRSFTEAIAHASSRVQCNKPVMGPHAAADVITFTDGTAIACLSEWTEYGEDTPPSIDPPKWWILASEDIAYPFEPGIALGYVDD